MYAITRAAAVKNHLILTVVNISPLAFQFICVAIINQFRITVIANVEFIVFRRIIQRITESTRQHPVNAIIAGKDMGIFLTVISFRIR